MRSSWRENLSKYFNASSIHGMHYLGNDTHWFEKLVWMAAIIASLTFSGLIIHQFFEEVMEDPITVSLKNIRIEAVPFPAVTIDAKSTGINPLGFAQKFLDMLAFYDVNVESTFNDSLKLRGDFRSIFHSIFNTTHAVMVTKSIHQNSSFDSINHWTVENYRNQIDQVSIKLATLFRLDKDGYRKAKIGLIDLILIIPKYLENWNPIFQQMEEIVTLQLSNKTLDDFDQKLNDCKIKKEECLMELKNANFLVKLLVNFKQYNFIPLGFGEFVSQLQGLISGGWQDINTQWPLFQLPTWKLTEPEILLRSYLKTILKDLSGKNLSDVSIYDLVNMLDLSPPVYENTNGIATPNYQLQTFSNVYQEKMNCRGTRPDPLYRLVIKEKDICKNKTSHYCCDILHQFDYSLATVLKVFKYSMLPPMFQESLEDILDTYDNLHFLGYKTWTADEQKVRKIAFNSYAMVLMCPFGNLRAKSISQEMPFCDKISPSFTNEGIGYSFNNANFWDMFINTSYAKTFASIMRPKGSIEKSCNHHHCKDSILYPKSSGSIHGLKLVLNSKDNSWGNKKSIFKIALHDPSNIADFRSSTILEAEPGYATTVYITPTQTLTNARNLNEHQRDCHFKEEHEIPSQIFKSYSHIGCVFECNIKHAFERCGCIPWNYPQFNLNQTICHRLTQDCFEKEMDSNEIDCHCPFDCIETKYSYTVSRNILDVSICADDNWTWLYDFLRSAKPDIIGYFRQIVYDEEMLVLSENSQKICQEYVENHMAIVSFHLTQPTVTQFVRNARVTFSGILANIGKQKIV